MAPLRYAVNFINTCKHNRRDVLQRPTTSTPPAPQNSAHQRLGGQEEDVHLPLGQVLEHLVPLKPRLVRVKTRAFQSWRKTQDLVVHEGNEWRDNESDARATSLLAVKVGRQLVAEGLARPCSCDHESGLARQDAHHNLLLPWAEGREAETLQCLRNN